MAEGQTPVEIFCSYTNADEMWLRKLETHLSLLKRQGLISFWHDRLIAPGTDWASNIDAHLETASVILLLVSANFFASDYCYGIEMKRALEREARGEARVIPILVRKADWTDAPFARLQVLPTDAKPIASWRDKDTALTDVAAGIRRVIVEELPQLTASAPRAALPAIWNIPYPHNPFFLGRDAELAKIRQQLQVGQATALSQPQAISGLGGIGKTQLALEYAYRYHQDYTAVLWAHAESTDALTSSYIAIAALLRLPEREAKEQDITVQAVKTWLQTHRAWLLILDNADNLALLPAFLPPILAGHLLLTTRAAATERLAHRLEIETLLLEQGALFLLRRATLLALDADLSHVSHQEQELARQLSLELGGLPLALDQAGAYLEETGCGLADYQQIYRHHRDELLLKRGGLISDHSEPVATTWSISFQQAQEKNPATADLLCVCAFLAPDVIPEEILTAGASFLGPVLAPVAADPFRLNQALEALRAYSLIRRNPTEKMLSIHRLVQAVLQDTLEKEARHIWRERAMLAVNAAFPHVEHETRPQCERLLTQALFATQSIEQDQVRVEEAGRLLYEMASYLRDRARYAEAESLLQRALRIQEQHLGPEHLEVATTLVGLASLYTAQGQYAEAESLLQRALRIREQRLGLEHPDVATTLNSLANLYIGGLDKYAEAEPLLQRALYILERQSGPKHFNAASPLASLAALYRRLGQYTKAEPLYRRALLLQEQRWGSENPRVAYSLSSLANLYSKQGKSAEAEPLYRRALCLLERQLGLGYPEATPPLLELATIYCDLGRYTEAEPLYQRALHIQEQQLGSKHLRVGYLLSQLADFYSSQGQYAKAEPLYQRALHIREEQLGPKHLVVAETVHDLARLWETQGNSKEARTWYERALTIREQALGRHHPKTTYTRKGLIGLLHEMGLHEEAAEFEAIQSAR
jgi:tetratricopeptide (TPR) repeat protein